MKHEVKAIIDGEIRILVMTDHEYNRIIHRSRDTARKKISSFHQFIIDILGIFKCQEIESSSEDLSEKQTEPTKEQ